MSDSSTPTKSSVLGDLLPSRPALVSAGVVALATLLLWKFTQVLAPFLVAFVLAYLLEPVAARLDRFFRRWPRESWVRMLRPRTLAVWTVFSVGSLFMVLAVLPFVFGLATNLLTLSVKLESIDLTQYKTIARDFYSEYQTRLEGIPLIESTFSKFVQDPDRFANLAGRALKAGARVLAQGLGGLGGWLAGVFSAGMGLLLVPLLLFYMMDDWPLMRRSFMGFCPAEYRPWFEGFLERVDETLGGFVRGQLTICLIFGLVMTLGLILLGLDYAMVIGPLAGVSNLIPYLGVIVGLVPSFIVALMMGGFTTKTLWLILGIVLLFAFLQFLDGFVFQPRIIGESVGLHPLAIFLALALGQQIMGLYGMVLAVPAAAVLRVVWHDLYGVLYPTNVAAGEAAPKSSQEQLSEGPTP